MNNKILSIDLGQSKTGIAISDELCFFAKPFEIFKHKNLGSQRDLADYVKKIVIDHKIKIVVVGYPLNADYSKNEKTKDIDRFLIRLKNRIDIPIELYSEYGSTKEALIIIRNNYKTGKRKDIQDDAIAAAVILQSFLDEVRQNEKQ